MSGSGGSTNQQRTQTTDLNPIVQPYVGDVLGESQRLYRSGAGSQVWNGPNVAGLNPYLTNSINQFGSNGLTGGQQFASGILGNIAGGGATPSRGVGGDGYASFGATPSSSAPASIATNTVAAGGPAPQTSMPQQGFAERPPSGPSGPVDTMNGGAHTIAGPAGVSSGGGAINTGGLYAGMLNQSLNQNTDAAGGAMGVGLLSMGPTASEAYLGDIAGGGRGPYTRDLRDISRGGAVNPITGDLQEVASGRAGSPYTGDLQDVASGNAGNSFRGGLLDMASANSNAPYQRDLQNVSSGAANTPYTSTYEDIANGNPVNPYLTQMLEANNARIANRVNSSMSGMGRYGSGSHADVLGRTLAETDNPILAQAYESGQNRRLSAADSLNNARNAAANTRISAASAGNSARLGAAQGLLGEQNSRVGAASSLNSALNAAANTRANAANDINTARLGAANARIGASSAINSANNAFDNTRIGAASTMDAARRGADTTALSGFGQAANIRQGDTGLGLQSIAGLTGVQGQNISNQMGAARQLFDMSGAGADRSMGIGGMLQNRDQADLMAKRELFDQANAMPWTQLSRYLGGVGGMSGLLKGTGTTTGNTNQQNQMGWNDWLRFGGNLASLA